ncbi:PH and SEC7 domain-containing protein 1-like [Pelodytes ibericus]
MEKLQLCLDEDDFPFFDAHPGTGTESYYTDRTAESNLIFNVTASTQNDQTIDPHRQAQAWPHNPVCNDQHPDLVESLGDEAGSMLSFNQPPKLSSQDMVQTKCSAAQDLFWASMLQAQLCVLELQDELEKKEFGPETPRCKGENPQLYMDSSVGAEQADGNVVSRAVEGHQENEEICCFEEELEDEILFCDNPIFSDIHSSSSAVQSSQGSYIVRSSMQDLIRISQMKAMLCEQSESDEGQAVLWNNNKAAGQDSGFEHDIKHTESLEILQIFENDWEEKEALANRTRAPKWPPSDPVHCSQENIHRPQDTTCNSRLMTPEISTSLEVRTEEEGLLFSGSNISMVAALLMEDNTPHNDSQSLTYMDIPNTPQIQGEPEEEKLSCEEVEDRHPLCQGCQGKEQACRWASEENAEETVSTQLLDSSEPGTQRTEQLAVVTSGSDEGTYVETISNINIQDLEAARCLAMKLFHLDGFERSQVAPYLQKNTVFSSMVAEEYLALFDFTGKTLDVALRSLMQELVLTGETQERERVLFHFAKRFHSCNPKDFGSADAVHTLTCALMLLNSDLHGQNIGKCMNLQDFINNLDSMNDGHNFPRELLKVLYNSIRSEKLEWAVSEEKQANALISKPENLLSSRKKSNPFLDIPCPDPQAPTYKDGMLYRKVHAHTDGKKTPWGKRGWKSFYTVLKGMVMFFLKDGYRSDIQWPEEVISVHHSLAERASDYTKKPNVFRLQTADWRVFLFQAQTSEEMNSWIARINLVAAMFSSPPFPAAIGSQKKFVRPILPSSPCKLCLEEQLQSHESWMDTFTDDLTEHQRNLPDPKSKARDWEDYHVREEYLRFEKSRYETYVKLLALRMQTGSEDLDTWESLLTEPDGGPVDNGGLKRSHSSPSLNPENSPMVIKVKRNISERRTYRRIIPKRNKNLV